MICLAVPDGVSEWTPEAEKQRISGDAYRGMWNQQIWWLKKRLPQGYLDHDDLWSLVTLWSLEAVNLFDKDRYTKFSTFLYGHIRFSSQKYQRTVWSVGKKPKDRNILLMSQSRTGSFKADLDFGVAGQQRDTSCESLLGDGCISDVCCFSDLAIGMQVTELMSNLSAGARDCFKQLTCFEDQKTLRDAFRRPYWRKRVTDLTGISRERLDHFKAELGEKVGLYV